MRTFRIEFDRHGSITSCIEVERDCPDGVLVLYIRATSADAAKAKAQAMRAKMAMRARREEYAKKGLCKDCGRKTEPGRKKCEVCLARQRESYTRLSAASKAPRYRETRATVKDSERLATLLEVKAKWFSPQLSPKAFGQWLLGEIDRLVRGKEAA